MASTDQSGELDDGRDEGLNSLDHTGLFIGGKVGEKRQPEHALTDVLCDRTVARTPAEALTYW